MSFRDLRVWRASVRFVVQIYRVTRSFPSHERFGLAAQLQRAAVSVPSNIAEGHGRITSGEWIQFLGHARGSLYEIETQLVVAHQLGYLDGRTYSTLFDTVNGIGKGVTTLIQDAKQRKRTTSNQ
ncbi:MAG TPA: four helix bundle protein [Thermoanaerobaculia bacterium]|nr:four helix bundle protein [Thermoanaerobaculia bacterium]